MQRLDGTEAFAALFERLPHAMVVSDPQRRIVGVNPAFSHVFGYTPDEVIGRASGFLYADPQSFDSDGRDRFRQAAAGSTSVFEAQYRRKNGQVFWAESVGVRVQSADGTLTAVVGLLLDISERRAAAAALAEALGRFTALFQANPTAMEFGRLDDTVLVDVNPAFEALLGYPRSEVIGRAIGDRLWIDQALLAQVRAEVRASGQVRDVDTRFRHHDGHEIDVLFSSRVMQVEGVPHFMTMIWDNRARKAAERGQQRQRIELEALVQERTAALAEANRSLARQAQEVADLYDRAPCGYHTLAPDGTVLSVNATELAMLGYTRDEFLGRPISSVMTPESQALFRQRFAEFQRTGRVRNLDYEFVRKDGSVLPVLISADAVRDAQGRIVANRATMVDDSDRRARERQIVQMQRELARRADLADAANRAKSAFLANMSHEIRTPMNAIIGLTHLMARDTHDPLQHDRLEKIDTAARHLLRIINDVLDLSKIEAGKMVLEDADFSVDDLFARAMEMVRGQAHAKGLELVLDTDGLPSHMRGDATRLAQALINLLANAVKFTEHGWVRLRADMLGEDPAGYLVRLAVTDTGPGIDPDRQNELFAPFAQADGSASRVHGGTGLGLSLTRHLARLMGGDAGLQSRPGEGSTFWVQVRLGRASEASQRTAPLTLTGLRTLVVDDLDEARAVIVERLRSFGMQVDEEASGQGALDRVQREMAGGRAYDAILVDWKMPGMDGIATLRALRATLGSGMPATVLVSAFPDPVLRTMSREASCDAVLHKPIAASALHDTLVRVLRQPGRPPPPIREQPVDGAAQQLRAHHAGQRVLVAEDNPVNLEVAMELLRSVGLVVESAEDGERAIELALTRPYDLILMDVQMPRRDGLDATREIRRRAGRGTAIVAMTANAFAEDRAACLAAGMNDHVGKPVDPSVLYAALLRWLPLRDPAPTGPSADAAASTQGLRARLAAVDPLDLDSALRRIGGSMPALERVLRRFATLYREGDPALHAAIATDDREAWRRACHALVGALGSIGANELMAQARDRVEDLGGSVTLDEVRPRVLALDHALRALATELDRALQAPG